MTLQPAPDDLPAIAIVGLGAALPGPGGLEELWTRLLAGENVASEPPAGRWVIPASEVHVAGGPAPDRVDSTKACFLERSHLLPAEIAGLDLPTSLLEGLDPVFHVTLRAGLAAWRDARLDRLTREERARTGVILGNIVLPTEHASRLALEALGRAPRRSAPLDRFPAGVPAALLARGLRLQGPAYTLDAACASSLYALSLAARELQQGRLDQVLAGGVSRPDSLYTQMGFSQLRALSPSGICAPFSAHADGLVVGEGAGVFVLRRLADAIAAGDDILGIIRAVGLSNDRRGSLFSPDREGQLRALRAAYARAGWSPTDVDWIECHGTGTPLGDEVEISSLEALWDSAGASTGREGRRVLGSVKSNVGHLLTAAGAAGLIKTLLALRHGTIPPTANFTRGGRALQASTRFEVLRAARPWAPRTGDTPRRVAVSSFGFGGINAHLLLEEYLPTRSRAGVCTFLAPRPPAPDVKVGLGNGVAVIGLSAHLGPWRGLEAAAERLLGAGGDSPAPPEGWTIGEAVIDWRRFRIPPRELEETLPQQLLALELAAEALDHAGIGEVDHADTGVHVGIALDLNTTNFHARWCAPPEEKDVIHPPLTANRTMGALGGIVASRVARWLRAGGPSYTVSAEDASGLRAVEAAARALADGTISLAVAGAIDLASDGRAVRGLGAVRALTRDGTCRPFTGPARGSVPGEGGVFFVLKRLDDALRDGDTVHAVLRGFGSTQGSGAPGAAPDPAAILRAMATAQAEARAPATTVSWIEAHASGDPEEDRAEREAIASLPSVGVTGPARAAGSAMARVGRAGAAAGAVSLLRACLCLARGIVPGDGGEGPRFWLRNRSEGPRRAGVTSLGVDGACHHVVVEEPPAAARAPSPAVSPGAISAGLFPLAGSRPAEVTAELLDLERLVTRHPAESPHRLAHRWLQRKRNAGPFVPDAALVLRPCPDPAAEIRREREALSSLIEEPGSEAPLPRPGRGATLFWSPLPLGGPGRTALVFPGSGSHFAGFGRDLFGAFPRVLQELDRGQERLASQLAGGNLWETAGREHKPLDPQQLILAQVSLSAAAGDLLGVFGIRPDAVIGYSLGESASLFATGAWSDRGEMLRRIEASTLFTRELAGPCEAARRTWSLAPGEAVNWLVGVVDRDREVVEVALRGQERVYLLIVNAPGECVLGGQRSQVDALVRRLGCRFHPLEGITTVHCEVARQAAEAYRALHLFEVTPAPGVTYYSFARGRAHVPTREGAADSILEQAVGTVDFPRVVESAYADGIRLFIEVGPGSSTARLIGRILGDRPHATLGAWPGPRDAAESFLRCLGGAISQGLPVNLDALYPPEGAPTAIQEPPHAVRVRCGTLLGVPLAPETAIPVEPAVPVPCRAPPELVASGREAKEAAASRAPVAVAGSTRAPTGLVLRLGEARLRTGEAQQAFLAAQLQSTRTLALALGQLRRSGPEETWTESREHTPLPPAPEGPPPVVASPAPAEPPASGTIPTGDCAPARQKVVPASVFLDRAACLEFAVGSIGRVLGERFAAIDAHPTRVRLPGEPLMLVDRIVLVEGRELSMTSGRVVTEHDVHERRWYLDCGKIPVSIAVESGQADLFLSGWLGIDFETRGHAVYRLLDAVVTFHGDLPGPGTTIRYDIRIERFFRQGSTWLFKFRFDATVEGRPLLTMRDGCAGFFTRAELDLGKGVVRTALDLRPVPGKRPDDWRDLVPLEPASYDDRQIENLRRGDLAGCFGQHFDGLPVARPVTLPAGHLRLVDRVERVEPGGGRFGLGLIRAELDIRPEDWFLTCHFVDDQVMPGTLMYECCLHTLRILLLRMGWVGETGTVEYHPVPGASSQLKCRGQVIATTRKVTYEVALREVGYRPEPYAIADALMYADGKPIVEMLGMSVRLTGLSREGLEKLWRERRPGGERACASPVDRLTASPIAPARAGGGPVVPGRRALHDERSILEFAVGKPSLAFGERYRVFDSERVIARLPGPPYQFLDRVVEISGCEPWKMTAGGVIEAEYLVPRDAWYFSENRSREMPFCVLLEAALQPCGWFSAYVGSALTSPIDLSYRNLGGSAVKRAEVTPETGLLTTRVKMTRVSSSGGMIIQHFELEVRSAAGPVYAGTTYFGFFSKSALADQVGLREASLLRGVALGAPASEAFPLPTAPPFPGDRLRMVSTVDAWSPAGGPAGLGVIAGSQAVDPSAWFFKAHFHQDPVWPGSLGLESFLQLLRAAAARRWGVSEDDTFLTPRVGHRHEWIYRGQVLPTNRRVEVEAVITAVDDAARSLTADGYLSRDGLPIYQMKGFTLQVKRRGSGG